MKTVIYQCDGKCGAATDKPLTSGWHVYSVTGEFDDSYSVHSCPSCWPALTLASVVDRT